MTAAAGCYPAAARGCAEGRLAGVRWWIAPGDGSYRRGSTVTTVAGGRSPVAAVDLLCPGLGSRGGCGGGLPVECRPSPVENCRKKGLMSITNVSSVSFLKAWSWPLLFLSLLGASRKSRPGSPDQPVTVSLRRSLSQHTWLASCGQRCLMVMCWSLLNVWIFVARYKSLPTLLVNTF